MYGASCLAILAVMGLALLRAVLGPSAFDRLMAVNMFGTKTVLLISVFGFLTGRPDFLDIALIYALVNFLGTIAVLRFFEGRKTPACYDEPAEEQKE
ncbi:MAG: cation:proton antiporter [Desulfuromonas sp.]|nr:cation:proton antiporter [Desulfuromonas sp.]